MVTASTPMREVHVSLNDEHNNKLKEITAKVWKDQKRGTKPKDSEGVRHAIIVAHAQMFPKK